MPYDATQCLDVHLVRTSAPASGRSPWPCFPAGGHVCVRVDLRGFDNRLVRLDVRDAARCTPHGGSFVRSCRLSGAGDDRGMMSVR